MFSLWSSEALFLLFLLFFSCVRINPSLGLYTQQKEEGKALHPESMSFSLLRRIWRDSRLSWEAGASSHHLIGSDLPLSLGFDLFVLFCWEARLARTRDVDLWPSCPSFSTDRIRGLCLLPQLLCFRMNNILPFLRASRSHLYSLGESFICRSSGSY